MREHLRERSAVHTNLQSMRRGDIRDARNTRKHMQEMLVLLTLAVMMVITLILPKDKK